MKVEFYGLAVDTLGVTFHLWSPWRCSELEHRLFEAVKSVPGAEFEVAADELSVHIDDPKQWKQANTHMARILKGWQEGATEAGSERRGWRWLIEADVDASGYDMQGEKAVFWAYVRLSLDRGGPGESEKGEDIDMNGFGVSMWNSTE